MVKLSYNLLNKMFTLRTDHSSLWWLDLFHDKATLSVIIKTLHEHLVQAWEIAR